MPKTKGTKADTVKKVTVDDLLPVLENTDFKLDEQPYPSLFAIYQKAFRDISVSTGLIHSDALALAGNGMPVVTSHRERKKRICTCLLIHKVTYRYFLIFENQYVPRLERQFAGDSFQSKCAEIARGAT